VLDLHSSGVAFVSMLMELQFPQKGICLGQPSDYHKSNFVVLSLIAKLLGEMSHNYL
jgi:hypothetical protein